MVRPRSTASPPAPISAASPASSDAQGRVTKTNGKGTRTVRGKGSYANKACNACEKAKKKCSGCDPCERCKQRGLLCSFERSEDREAETGPEAELRRVKKEIERMKSTLIEIGARGHLNGYAWPDRDQNDGKEYWTVPGLVKAFPPSTPGRSYSVATFPTPAEQSPILGSETSTPSPPSSIPLVYQPDNFQQPGTVYGIQQPPPQANFSSGLLSPPSQVGPYGMQELPFAPSTHQQQLQPPSEVGPYGMQELSFAPSTQQQQQYQPQTLSLPTDVHDFSGWTGSSSTGNGINWGDPMYT